MAARLRCSNVTSLERPSGAVKVCRKSSAGKLLASDLGRAHSHLTGDLKRRKGQKTYTPGRVQILGGRNGVDGKEKVSGREPKETKVRGYQIHMTVEKGNGIQRVKFKEGANAAARPFW